MFQNLIYLSYLLNLPTFTSITNIRRDLKYGFVSWTAYKLSFWYKNLYFNLPQSISSYMCGACSLFFPFVSHNSMQHSNHWTCSFSIPDINMASYTTHNISNKYYIHYQNVQPYYGWGLVGR